PGEFVANDVSLFLRETAAEPFFWPGRYRPACFKDLRDPGPRDGRQIPLVLLDRQVVSPIRREPGAHFGAQRGINRVAVLDVGLYGGHNVDHGSSSKLGEINFAIKTWRSQKLRVGARPAQIKVSRVLPSECDAAMHLDRSGGDLRIGLRAGERRQTDGFSGRAGFLG